MKPTWRGQKRGSRPKLRAKKAKTTTITPEHQKSAVVREKR
jgi:hypothetical protein